MIYKRTDARFFFLPCFEMTESLEDLDDILRDWGKDKVQKILSKH